MTTPRPPLIRTKGSVLPSVRKAGRVPVLPTVSTAVPEGNAVGRPGVRVQPAVP